MAIIGDSYSTFEGYVPEGYFCWYMLKGNECENDMPGVEKTWWYQLSRENDLEIVMNCSFSGSAVCYSGYPDMPDRIGSAFISRMKVDLGEKRTTPEPDILLIFGGTNDFWAESPLGEIKYGDWTEEDFVNFSPSYCYMLAYLKKWNPNAKIYNLLNDEITSEIRDIMKEACKHYGIEMIELEGIEKENGHPNTMGMRQIANQVAKVIM